VRHRRLESKNQATIVIHRQQEFSHGLASGNL
jgi:hypothetical protein